MHKDVKDFIEHLKIELRTERDGRADDPTTYRALQCVYRAVFRAEEALAEQRAAEINEAHRLANLPRCPLCGTHPPCDGDCR